MTRWSIVNIVSLLTALIATALITASGVALLSSYHFDRYLAQRSLETISSTLQSGGLPFAVATQDVDLISSIVGHHLKNDLVYAIEVMDSSGSQVYRGAKDISDSVKIAGRAFDLHSPYSAISLNKVDLEDSPETNTLGSIIIYFTTEQLDNSILGQAAFGGGILLLSIIFITVLLYIFNRLISTRLARAMTVIEALEHGEPPEWNDREAPSIYELRVIYNALKHLSNTILDRDLRLKQSLEEALEAKYQSQQAEQFKDDFIRRISHDIRTPVGVVRNLLDLIYEESQKANLHKSLLSKINSCTRSAHVLSDVTTELFDFDQFERMNLVEIRSEIDVREFFRGIYSLYEHQFGVKGLNFSLRRISSNVEPSIVSFDYSKVTLIMENILDNALKFTKTGAVSVEWLASRGSIEVNIRDSGIGIPEDKLNLIFDKHTQLEEPNTSIHQGRGLGLFYVSRLCEVIGATVSVTSKCNIGSCFSLVFPYSPPDINCSISAGHFRDSNESLIVDAKLFESLKVLIIDDDEATCFTLGQMLFQHGVKSATENIPEIGYKRILEEAPDLVFIDYHMPRLSGDTLAQKAKSRLSHNATFLVCITAESNPEALYKLSETFSEIYIKPFNPKRLREILENVVRSKMVAASIVNTFKP